MYLILHLLRASYAAITTDQARFSSLFAFGIVQTSPFMTSSRGVQSSKIVVTVSIPLSRLWPIRARLISQQSGSLTRFGQLKHRTLAPITSYGRLAERAWKKRGTSVLGPQRRSRHGANFEIEMNRTQQQRQRQARCFGCVPW
jgi:hypothetical protein